MLGDESGAGLFQVASEGAGVAEGGILDTLAALGALSGEPVWILED
jgi:hypothetical protein